jgi:hypothetical protein
MKNKEIKEMTTEERREFLLYHVQMNANCVLWDIRDDDSEIMMSVRDYKRWYRVYRNVKLMLGEPTYESPFQDIVLSRGTWESF